jgi:hypothetical protein
VAAAFDGIDAEASKALAEQVLSALEVRLSQLTGHPEVKDAPSLNLGSLEMMHLKRMYEMRQSLQHGQLRRALFGCAQKGEDRNVEGQLVQLLNFEKFDLIKELLKNRLKIVWCTRLERAQGDAERARIEVKSPT